MINQENLNNLYDGLIEQKELTTKELKGYGFNTIDIAKLIEDGIIKRIKRGHYSFLDVDKLCYYGKNLLANKEYKQATRCFEKCYEINPKHGGSCFRLFLNSIKNKNYDKIMDYFEGLYYSENMFYNHDADLYLYLLSMIIELPENIRNMLNL